MARAGKLALKMVQRVFPGVSRVVDGKKDIHIDVTKKDAASKAVKNHKDCALAVACKRSFDLDGALIARSVAYLVEGSKATRYTVPVSAQHEIVAFDRGAEFASGEYVLKAPTNSRVLGTVRGKGGSGTKTGTALKRFQHITENVRSSLKTADVV